MHPCGKLERLDSLILNHHFVFQNHFTPAQWSKSTNRLMEGTVPMASPLNRCTCDSTTRNPSPRKMRVFHDHGYASSKSPYCKQRGSLGSAQRALSATLLRGCGFGASALRTPNQHHVNGDHRCGSRSVAFHGACQT